MRHLLEFLVLATKKPALNANALLDRMAKSSAAIANNASGGKGGQLNPKSKAQKPFWSG
ncbi:MAG: hypothetical protein H0U43_01610 [Chthoniobacterales bacterium]|nr:hypothetical protein [Chthoniobacterales bacterium]